MTLPSKLMSPVMAGRAMAGPARPQMAVAAQRSRFMIFPVQKCSELNGDIETQNVVCLFLDTLT